MEEIWKEIDGGYEQYQVSNLGRIKSLKRKKEKILHLDKDRYGYMNVYLSKDGVMKKFKVHRLVAIAFIENTNNYPEINHIDGNKENNSVDNLEWVTRSQNLKHAHKMGLKKFSTKEGLPCGGVSYREHNGNHKLTEHDVDEIRKLYIPNSPIFGGRALARKYGVGATTIWNILNNNTWTEKSNEKE